ncbi:MAG: hypothetical protein KJP21_07585 [Bacteroidia bacterium]|nr:hypothetical protein [Bacteroidia bacterium]NNJ55947.1 hypothetical protein [Bacteroidia bacterium]
MKLNKSILGIALMLVFLLGACSQARYGNLTRRTKATHLAKKEVKKEVKQTPLIVEEVIENEDQNSEVILINKDVEQISYQESDDKSTVSSTPKVKTEFSIKENDKVTKLAGPLQKKALKKVLKNLDKNDNNVKPNNVNDDSSLLRLVLIIVLVLLILALIGKLLPGLNWLLGVLLLIVLIWLVLQYI